MKSYAWMFVLIAAFLFLVAGCGGQTGDLVEDISEDVAQEEDAQEEAVEESVERKAASEVLGVVVGFSESTDSPAITMLVDGSPEEYPVDDDIYQLVVEDWDHYSHWGLYQALIDDSGIVFSLEYGEGVADIIGIFSDYYTGKELPDVI